MSGEALTPELIKILSDPRVSLREYGSVLDQKSSRVRRFDPTAITRHMQNTIVSYVAAPPRTPDGQLRWLVLAGSRQGGKSTVPEMACYPLAMYNPGWLHLCIADKKDRADELHKRTQFNHQYWPDELRVPQKVTSESRKLTFEHGGSMQAESANTNAVGVGLSPDSMHMSEVPLWADAASVWTNLLPAMQNRDECRLIMESTPYPLDRPSAEFFRDICDSAYRKRGRLLYAFFPFWDNLLHVRPWDPAWTKELDELRLMDRYGPKGLTWDNLAFRRFQMDSDPQIRLWPELFGVFFPFDDVSCWLSSGGGLIPAHTIEKAAGRADPAKQKEWDPPYTEFEAPEPGAVYVIGADPAGYGRDHSAFQVLKVWEGEWTQVAAFGDDCDPIVFGQKLQWAGERYNMARIAVERNGVGIGATTQLQLGKYPNIHYDDAYKPGIHKHSHDKMLTLLAESLMDSLVLNDPDTIKQLKSYRGDKAIERTPAAELLSGESKGGRRLPRHHWDKVSGLAVACVVARSIGRRIKPVQEVKEPVVLAPGSAAWEKYVSQVKADERAKRRPRRSLIRRR